MHSREYHDTCMQCCWCRSWRSDVEPWCALPCLQAEECTWMHCGTVANVHWRLKKLLNKVVVFVFFAHKRYYRNFIKLILNQKCHTDYFNNVLTTFLGLELGSCVAVYERSESSRINPNVCSEDEQRFYGFGTTWGWVIHDRILILGWTIFLNIGWNGV